MGWLHTAEQTGVEYVPRLLGALVVYLFGKWLIGRVVAVTGTLLARRRIDPSLKTFFVSFLRIGLLVLLGLAIIGIVGIPIAGFAAIIAGLAFGIGSALNGSLGNVAGGIVILITRPFGIGDLIEAQSNFGIVEEIGIIHTTILTSQNRTVHLPNGALSTGVITNYTKRDHLRIDLPMPVPHGTDIDLARKVAIEAMQAHPMVMADPAPQVKVKQVKDSGIVLVLWPRIKVKDYDATHPRQMEADYYNVYFGVQELVKKAFQQHGITGPAMALDVAMDAPTP
ncbi:MAG TPA: mechanosensitive ion channel family protein [Rhodanobacteraceae bacterium]